MKAITATRKQSLIFLVPDGLASRFENNDLSYDELCEEINRLEYEGNEKGTLDGNDDFLVYASTEEADLDSIIPMREAKKYISFKDCASIVNFIKFQDKEGKL